MKIVSQRDAPIRPLQFVGVAVLALVSLAVAVTVARRVADHVVLTHHYGADRVSAEGLTIQEAGRARLHISNGDVLGQAHANAAHGIFAVGALFLFFVLLSTLWLCVRRIAPWAVPAKM